MYRWDVSWNNDAAGRNSHYVVESHEDYKVYEKSAKSEHQSRGGYAEVKGSKKGTYYSKGGKSGKLA